MDAFLKVAALLGTAAFFLYQVFAGSLAAGTSLSLEVKPADQDGKRVGFVTVHVERGKNWTVIVNSAELRVVVDGQRSVPVPITFKDYTRETFRLSPDEKTQYGAVVDLPRDKAATVEALFVMQQQFYRTDPAYVFASAVVPPAGTDGGK